MIQLNCTLRFKKKTTQKPLRLAKLTCVNRQLVNTGVMSLNLLDGIDPFDNGMKATYIQTLMYLHSFMDWWLSLGPWIPG